MKRINLIGSHGRRAIIASLLLLCLLCPSDGQTQENKSNLTGSSFFGSRKNKAPVKGIPTVFTKKDEPKPAPLEDEIARIKSDGNISRIVTIPRPPLTPGPPSRPKEPPRHPSAPGRSTKIPR